MEGPHARLPLIRHEMAAEAARPLASPSNAFHLKALGHEPIFIGPYHVRAASLIFVSPQRACFSLPSIQQSRCYLRAYTREVSFKARSPLNTLRARARASLTQPSNEIKGAWPILLGHIHIYITRSRIIHIHIYSDPGLIRPAGGEITFPGEIDRT